MAPPHTLPPDPTEDFEPPPDDNETIKNHKRVTFNKNSEAKDHVTTNIQNRRHHQPSSTQRKLHVPQRPRKPYVKATQQLIDSTKTKSTKNGNEPPTSDEITLRFTTRTAQISETMKRTTEALQTMLAEQRAASIQRKQEFQAASIQRKQEFQAASIQRKQEFQAAFIQQKQQDKSFEQMLQTFLTQNQEIRQSSSSRTSRLISATSEKRSEKKPCANRATQQPNSSEKQSTDHCNDTIIRYKSEKLPEFELEPPPPEPSFWNDPTNIDLEIMNAKLSTCSHQESLRRGQSTNHRNDTISDKSEQISELDFEPPPPGGPSFWSDQTNNDFEMMQGQNSKYSHQENPALAHLTGAIDTTAHPIHSTTPATLPTLRPPLAHSARLLFRALNDILSFPTPPDRLRSNAQTPALSHPIPTSRTHLTPLFRALNGFLSFPTPPDRPHSTNSWTSLFIIY